MEVEQTTLDHCWGYCSVIGNGIYFKLLCLICLAQLMSGFDGMTFIICKLLMNIWGETVFPLWTLRYFRVSVSGLGIDRSFHFGSLSSGPVPQFRLLQRIIMVSPTIRQSEAIASGKSCFLPTISPEPLCYMARINPKLSGCKVLCGWMFIRDSWLNVFSQPVQTSSFNYKFSI